jgi:hypothetical protein
MYKGSTLRRCVAALRRYSLRYIYGVRHVLSRLGLNSFVLLLGSLKTRIQSQGKKRRERARAYAKYK